jgi:hypothetical protein
MRSSLSVCGLTVVLASGCLPSDQSAYQPGDDESDRALEYDESDSADDFHYGPTPADGGIWHPPIVRDAAPPPPCDPGFPVDAGPVQEPWPTDDAGVPIPEDAGAPVWPVPSNCLLLRFGDDRTCVDIELLARDALVACSAAKGELKSLTLQSGQCFSGASAAEATCCFPTAPGWY